MSTLAMMTFGCSMGYAPFLLAQGYSDVTNVFDLFFLVHVGHMMQFDGVLASAKGVSGLEQLNDFQRVKELPEIWIHLLVPGTLPLDLQVVTPPSQGILFLEGDS